MEDNILEYAVIGSGSSANSYVIKEKNNLYVIDNGFSYKEFSKRMALAGLDPQRVELVFLTHTHGDHLKGVELLSRKHDIPVVCHEKLDLQYYTKKAVPQLEVEYDKPYTYKSIIFEAFKTYHDASYSCGYTFVLPKGRLTIITDTGKVSEKMKDMAAQSEILFLESNYSKSLLSNGPYPEHLKKRISSSKGHLSNEDAAMFMEEVSRMKQCKLKQIYLCHLSKNNNTKDQTKKEISEIYTGEIPWKICNRDELVLSPSLDLQLIS